MAKIPGSPSSAPRNAAAAGRPSFGSLLQSARIARRIRLEEVAEQTRIGLAVLEAIEQEEFKRLPPDVFTIGFLRAYAQAVGVDGDEAVLAFREHPWRPQRVAEESEPPLRQRNPAVIHLVFCLALLAALIALSLFGVQRLRHPTAEHPPVASARVAATTTAPAATQHATEPASEAVKIPHQPAGARHVLIISAQDDSWVKAVIDQGNPSEHRLKAGQQIQLVAEHGFNLLIGNVGGVKLNLDGKPVTVPGKRGEVVNLNLP